jgi:radical SAM protein with 4Fe4S-binding SPASM domain
LFSGYSPAKSLNEHPCDYQFGSVIVEKGDEVRFCPSLRNAGIGKLSFYNSFEDTYKANPDFMDFLSKSINDLPCRSCRYAKLFHGGCRANSLSYNGKMWDRDPICCSLSPFVEDEIVPLMPKPLRETFYASLQGGKRPDEEGHPAYESIRNSQVT